MNFKSIVQRVHLWTGLILGTQVLLWMASGVFMSWFHITLVRGESNSVIATPPELEATAYASPGGVIAQMNGATSLELHTFQGRPVYEVRDINGVALFNARTGEKLSPISEDTARHIAKNDYSGDAEIVKVALMAETPYEYRLEKPVWRVDFGDRFHTRIYISPSTGEVSSRRNDIWRIFDFLWMLHIMDYDERDDVNNWFLKIASAAGLMFAISGLIIVVLRFKHGRYANDLALVVGKKRATSRSKSK